MASTRANEMLEDFKFSGQSAERKTEKNTSLCREKPYTTNDDATLEALRAQTQAFIHHRDTDKMNKKACKCIQQSKKETLRVIIIFHS